MIIVIDILSKPFNLNEQQAMWGNEMLNTMSLQEKVEQLFCPIVYSNDEKELTKFIQKYHVGGIVFRAGKSGEIQHSHRTLQSFSKIPLLIAANLEDGGSGITLDGTYMGRQMLVAATGDTQKAWQLGKICGREGSALGVNWAFAPVVDIDMNDHNPITNVRTYGNDADRVFSMSKAYAEALAEEGLAACVKHFPGDGVDERDQHLLTSVNTLSCEDWDETYGKIYKGLIDAGVKTVMAGHIAMPAYEAFFNQGVCTKVIPATLSKNLLIHLLRERLGFNGLICSDATPMAGFCSAMDRKTAVPTAIANGCDMFLFNVDLDEDIQYMKDGIRSGILSVARVDEAVTRILALKVSLGLFEKQAEGTLVPEPSALNILRNAEHESWAMECADMGVTLVKDSQKLLPICVKRYPKILIEIIGNFPSNDNVYRYFEHLLKKEGFQVTKYTPETPGEIMSGSRVQDFKSRYDLVIYIGNVENASNQTVARIQWHTLFGKGNNIPWFVHEVPVMFISVGNPYHLLDVPMIKTYINAYCNTPYVMDAVVEKIMGRSAFNGKNPIDPFCGKWDLAL